jgi:hypothetical protein
MSFNHNNNLLEIPDGYSPDFAKALYEYRMGNITHSVLREIKQRFGTERFFVEAVEAIYQTNEWKLDIKTKRDLKRIFKES